MKRTILLLIICFLLGYQAIGSEVRGLSDTTSAKASTTDTTANSLKKPITKKSTKDSEQKGGQTLNFEIQPGKTILEINEKSTRTITLPKNAPGNIKFIATSSDTNVLKAKCNLQTIYVTPIGEGIAKVTIYIENDSQHKDSINSIDYTVRLPYDSLKAERDELQKKLQSINSDDSEDISRFGNDDTDATSNECEFNKLGIILGVIAGLLLIILIIVLVLKKKADAQTRGSQTELQGLIADLENKVQGLTKEKEELESLKSNWEREKRSLEQEITGLRNKKAPAAPTAPSPKPAPPQPQSLYADAIVNGKFNRVKEQPDSAETNFELRLDSPTATSAKIYIYSGAERRILANPAFLEGCDKQILGNSRVETTRPGLAQKEGENNWVITKKPEVIIR